MTDEAKTVAEQLEEIEREEKAEAAEAEAKAAARKIERHALKKRLELETKGKEGEAFAIVETPSGLLAFRKGESLYAKRFKKSDMNDADQEQFLAACLLSPDPDRFVKILEAHYAVLDECLGAVLKLYGAKLEARRKK